MEAFGKTVGIGLFVDFWNFGSCLQEWSNQFSADVSKGWAEIGRRNGIENQS